MDRAERAFINRKCMKWDIVYKIASIDLRLHRPQLQHWLFFKNDWPTLKFENSNVVGLSAPPVCPLPATYCKATLIYRFCPEKRFWDVSPRPLPTSSRKFKFQNDPLIVVSIAVSRVNGHRPKHAPRIFLASGN